MKRHFSNLFQKSGMAALILAGALALCSPAAVMAQRSQGGHGYSGGNRGSSGGSRGYSGGNRGYSGGGRSFGGGGERFARPAPSYRGGGNYRGYYGGGGRNRYYGRGYGYGYYSAPYAYGYSWAPDYCDPAGYYDNWGRWIPAPGCAVVPYGY
jgi:hypothetical protein